MKIFKIIFGSLFLMSIASCSRTTLQTIGTSKNSQVYLKIDTIHSKLNINKQKTIEGTAVYKQVLGFTVKSPSNLGVNDINGLGFGKMETLKNAAIRDALNNNNFEYLIAPRYNIIKKKTLFSKEIIVKVEGYGANLQIQ